jgi:hypothetical protein
MQYQRVLAGKRVFINKKLIMPDPISSDLLKEI